MASDLLIYAMVPVVPDGWQRAHDDELDAEVWTDPHGVRVTARLESLPDDGHALIFHVSVSSPRGPVATWVVTLVRRLFFEPTDAGPIDQVKAQTGVVHLYAPVPEAVRAHIEH